MTEYITKERAQQLVIDSCTKYHFADDGMLESLAAIEKEPAADVAPVRHGRWLPQIVLGKKAWDCSECKTLGSPHWKWCPMCGCRMDGEERPTCHDGVCDIPGISQGEIIGGAE